jgi:GNAT superfamily N-acetyltransferase
MTINIRQAIPSDAVRLWQLICDLAAFQGHPGAVRTSPESLRQQMENATPPFECLVADADGCLVGFALYYHNYSTWEGKQGIYLEDFYVTDQCRGTGVGKMLLSTLADLALKRGCARIDWNVLSTNHMALRFYERIGGSALNDWITWRLDKQHLSALALQPEICNGLTNGSQP